MGGSVIITLTLKRKKPRFTEIKPGVFSTAQICLVNSNSELLASQPLRALPNGTSYKDAQLPFPSSGCKHTRYGSFLKQDANFSVYEHSVRDFDDPLWNGTLCISGTFHLAFTEAC